MCVCARARACVSSSLHAGTEEIETEGKTPSRACNLLNLYILMCACRGGTASAREQREIPSEAVASTAHVFERGKACLAAGAAIGRGRCTRVEQDQ